MLGPARRVQPACRREPRMSQVVTGEAVAIDLRVARLGSRTVAALLDAVVQVVAMVGLLLALRPVIEASDPTLVAALVLLVYVVGIVGYPVAFEALWRGQTPGKAAMGLRVVRDDGGPIRFRQALVRGLVGAVAERPGPFLGAPAVVTMLVTERSKRLGDVLAGTVVLQERVPSTGAPVPGMPPPLAGWAPTLDLSGLGDDLALAARQFLGRAGELSPAAREQLGGQLVAAVQAVVTPPPPPGTPGWAYLAAVLAERRRRAELRLTPPATGSTATAPRPPIDGPRGVVPPPPAGAFAPPS